MEEGPHCVHVYAVGKGVETRTCNNNWSQHLTTEKKGVFMYKIHTVGGTTLQQNLLFWSRGLW